MDKKIFVRYADIKTQIKALQTEADEISKEVTLEMEKEQVEKVESDFGTFFFTSRKSWEYSPKVESAAEKLKALKKKEEETGVAVATETKSLTFRNK